MKERWRKYGRAEKMRKRCKQLLDDLQGNGICWRLKEETQNGEVARTRLWTCHKALSN
jgi:predicted metal-dependent hydrolase